MRQYKIQINKSIIDNMKKGQKHFRENEKLENNYNIIYDIDTKDNIRLVHRRQEMP